VTAAELIERLDMVRQTGPDRWLARCPAHADRSPSLSVRETGDGTVLIHCFAGCGAAEVVQAVGLELRDLFPRDNGHTARHCKGTRPRWNHKELLEILADEARIVNLAAGDIAQGKSLSPDDLARIKQAGRRIEQIAGVIHG